MSSGAPAADGTGSPRGSGDGAGASALGDGTSAGSGADPVRLLFVCLGNICRSPTAEGVMRALVREAGVEDRFLLDSAGTGRWQVGRPPDPRARAAAAARGITLEGRARQVEEADLIEFDLILAMDGRNRADLLALAFDAQTRAKVRMLREFDPASDGASLDVPDPYTGGPDGFEEVLDLVTAACRGLLESVLAEGPGLAA